MTKTAILIHTVREGKDADEFWHVVDYELAKELNAHDPWATLGDYEHNKDPRILAGHLRSRKAAEKAAIKQGYTVDTEVMDAVGY